MGEVSRWAWLMSRPASVCPVGLRGVSTADRSLIYRDPDVDLTVLVLCVVVSCL